MILIALTKEKNNVEVSALPISSNQLVWWQCDNCGLQREFNYAYARRKEKMARENGVEDLCQRCSHSHRKGKPQIGSGKCRILALPPETMVEETKAKFGYDPFSLGGFSRKSVLVKCSVLGTIHEVRRIELNRSKSILETGHYISIGGVVKRRMKGKKVSLKTRKLMSESQIKRRKLEQNKEIGFFTKIVSKLYDKIKSLKTRKHLRLELEAPKELRVKENSDLKKVA